MAATKPRQSIESEIAERIERFRNVLSSAVYAQTASDLVPVMEEATDLLARACIIERLVFTRNVLKNPGVPRVLIDRLLADNFLVARMLTQAGFALDDDRTIRLLATGDEAFRQDVAAHEGISERITEYLVEIGSPEVAIRLVQNKHAKLSPSSVVALIERAQNDLKLLHAIAIRTDLADRSGSADIGEPEYASGLGAKAGPRQSIDATMRRASRRLRVINHR
jgi:hypothetical protein